MASDIYGAREKKRRSILCSITTFAEHLWALSLTLLRNTEWLFKLPSDKLSTLCTHKLLNTSKSLRWFSGFVFCRCRDRESADCVLFWLNIIFVLLLPSLSSEWGWAHKLCCILLESNCCWFHGNNGSTPREGKFPLARRGSFLSFFSFFFQSFSQFICWNYV